MRIYEYTFTGFLPSGNPFKWYYDETKPIAFTTSIFVQTWDKEPKIGDKISIHEDEHHRVQKVFINGEQVYEYSKEKVEEAERINDAIYDNLKEMKGFKKAKT